MQSCEQLFQFPILLMLHPLSPTKKKNALSPKHFQYSFFKKNHHTAITHASLHFRSARAATAYRTNWSTRMHQKHAKNMVEVLNGANGTGLYARIREVDGQVRLGLWSRWSGRLECEVENRLQSGCQMDGIESIVWGSLKKKKIKLGFVLGSGVEDIWRRERRR